MIAVMWPHQWMASVDLKDAYFHIRVVPAHCQYLRFHWVGQSIKFKALPFGLSSALPSDLHQDTGFTCGLAQANGCTVIPVPR